MSFRYMRFRHTPLFDDYCRCFSCVLMPLLRHAADADIFTPPCHIHDASAAENTPMLLICHYAIIAADFFMLSPYAATP